MSKFALFITIIILVMLINITLGCSDAATQATPPPELGKTDLTWDKDQWGKNWN